MTLTKEQLVAANKALEITNQGIITDCISISKDMIAFLEGCYDKTSWWRYGRKTEINLLIGKIRTHIAQLNN